MHEPGGHGRPAGRAWDLRVEIAGKVATTEARGRPQFRTGNQARPHKGVPAGQWP
jgi:hypothetical protein